MGGRALAALAVLLTLVASGCGGSVRTAVDQTGRWERAAPADEGVDAARLRALDRALRRRYTDVLSFLVARDGRLVFEGYYRGRSRDTIFDVYSVTKSVTSALVGIALRDGRIKSLDQTLGDYFDGRAAPAARRITVRQLLTMTAGWAENDGTLDEAEPVRDWVRFLSARPLSSPPGLRFGYDGGSSHLLSALVHRATGLPLEELARRELWAPLGIRKPFWTSDRIADNTGATGLQLRARDMAKLGQLYLQRGRWGGRQIVPAWYVDASTRRQVPAAGIARGYGYQWWIVDGGFAAVGFAEQVVAVFPKLDLVVAATTDPSPRPGVWDLIREYVLPAARG